MLRALLDFFHSDDKPQIRTVEVSSMGVLWWVVYLTLSQYEIMRDHVLVCALHLGKANYQMADNCNFQVTCIVEDKKRAYDYNLEGY